MEFIKKLYSLLFSNKEDFHEFIRDFLGDTEEIECSHTKNKPESEEACCKYIKYCNVEDNSGSLRHPAVKQSTIFKSACKFTGKTIDKNQYLPTRTSVRIHQLAVFLTYPLDEVLELIQEMQDNSWNVLHGCGCGILEGGKGNNCNNYKHLYLDTQKQNIKDAGYHLLLKDENLSLRGYLGIIETLREDLHNKNTF